MNWEGLLQWLVQMADHSVLTAVKVMEIIRHSYEQHRAVLVC